ncbi:hypothetical protein PALB_1090 [Pseudoalteromonas luteoviolacea B = ATCC 29581]|nr:hypothetical protein PALB_1090 [Pseudoalteromonas luteoviolacea B = ATCC 29581]
MKAPLCKDAFWQFSCALYAKPGVQSALLAEQNENGKNINLILLLRYLETIAFAVDLEALDAFMQCCSHTDAHLLHPQRAARAHLKANYAHFADYETTRQLMLNAELASERVQQHELLNVAQSLDLSQFEHPNNLDLYLQNDSVTALLRAS